MSYQAALARSGLIFQNVVRKQEKPDILCVKRACHDVLTGTMVSVQSSHDVLSSSYGVLVGDSLHSHDALDACTVLT